ncbi:MAG: hypothetical protein ACRC9Y_09125 [Aeromonas veronii]
MSQAFRILLNSLPMGSDAVALEMEYDNVDAVPEAYRALYAEVDGKMVFNAIKDVGVITPEARELADRYEKLSADYSALRLSLDEAKIGKELDEAVQASGALAGTGVATVKALLGEVKLNDAGVLCNAEGLPVSAMIKELKGTHPFLWPESVGASAVSSSRNVVGDSSNPWSKKDWNLTKQCQIYANNPTRAAQLATMAGTFVGGPKPAR